MASQRTIQWLSLGLASFALCGCLGGTIAQQIVQTLLIQGADKATTAALDSQEKKTLPSQKIPPPDKYDIAFLNSTFEKVTVQIEPLPKTALDEEKPLLPQEAKLVQVEVWSLLIGDEKQRILENAKKQGSTEVPPKNEWQQSQVAVGAATNKDIASNKQVVITFLIPPEVGKLHSGSKALVELSGAGQLNVARYTVN